MIPIYAMHTIGLSKESVNPRANLITGSVCGIKIEEIDDPIMQKIRWPDKLADEPAKGKPMEKILR